MVSKPEHHIGDKFRHRRRRTFRTGEEIDVDALERGDAILEEVTQSEEIPDGEQVEPWGYPEDKPMPERVVRALASYRERFPDRDEEQ